MGLDLEPFMFLQYHSLRHLEPPFPDPATLSHSHSQQHLPPLKWHLGRSPVVHDFKCWQWHIVYPHGAVGFLWRDSISPHRRFSTGRTWHFHTKSLTVLLWWHKEIFQQFCLIWGLDKKQCGVARQLQTPEADRTASATSLLTFSDRLPLTLIHYLSEKEVSVPRAIRLK